MKPASVVIFILSVTVFSACNSEVFIDDFLPDSPEIVLTDGRATVDFSSDNWGILSVGGILSFPVRVYDLEGNLSDKSFPLSQDDFAVISINDDLHDFSIEKRDRRKLDIVLGENMQDEFLYYGVVVGNEYEKKTISIAFPPSAKYQIDSIVYEYDAASLSDNEIQEVESLLVNNTTSSPVKFVFFPYKNSFREVSVFYDGNQNQEFYSRMFGDVLPEIPIPDVVDGSLSVKDSKCSFGLAHQRLESGMNPEFKAEASVNAGDKRRLVVYNCIENYRIPFSAYASNPGNGKQRIFTGTIISERPYSYLIFKQRVDDQ